MSKELLFHIQGSESDYFLFSELAWYEKYPLPDSLIQDARSVCEKSLIRHFEEALADYGDEFKNVALGEGRKWAQEVFRVFVKSYQMN